ncbi:hypothetical protein M5361_12555 [Ligilactobacillus agilis]|nr:hypothetical protein [Ligilactobacillus agilis]
MSQQLDVFAHILPLDFYQRMLALEPTLLKLRDGYSHNKKGVACTFLNKQHLFISY